MFLFLFRIKVWELDENNSWLVEDDWKVSRYRTVMQQRPTGKD